MPLIQPGKVLRWSGQPADVTTQDLISSGPRMAFDSLHGGVWHTLQRKATAHQAPRKEGHPSGHIMAAGTAEQLLQIGPLKHGPAFYRSAETHDGFAYTLRRHRRCMRQ